MTAPLIDRNQTNPDHMITEPIDLSNIDLSAATTSDTGSVDIDSVDTGIVPERIPGVEYLEDTHPILKVWDKLCASIRAHYSDERGMSTIEYALGCVAAAALGALLYVVVTSDAVESALSGIFERALSEGN